MVRSITKDTVLCMSLARRPSHIGTRFHNFLYAELSLDVVALPALTPLVRRARAQGKQVITGPEVIALQALEQFVLYTGVRPTDDQVRRASEFSRA
jgi:shikimate 5-dehydrogenase